MHNDENTEQGDGNDKVEILQNNSNFGREHLREPLLHAYEGLLRIHGAARQRKPKCREGKKVMQKSIVYNLHGVDDHHRFHVSHGVACLVNRMRLLSHLAQSDQE